MTYERAQEISTLIYRPNPVCSWSPLYIQQNSVSSWKCSWAYYWILVHIWARRADEHIGFWPYMSVLMKAHELANICTKIQYAHEHPHIYTKIQYPHENAHNLVHIWARSWAYLILVHISMCVPIRYQNKHANICAKSTLSLKHANIKAPKARYAR